MQSKIVDRAREIVHVLLIVDIAVIVTVAMRLPAVISRIASFVANQIEMTHQFIFLVKLNYLSAACRVDLTLVCEYVKTKRPMMK